MSICGLKSTLEDGVGSKQFATHLRPLGSLASEYERQSSEPAGFWGNVLQFFKARLQSLNGVALNCTPMLMYGSPLTKRVDQIFHELRARMTLEVFCKKLGLSLDPFWVVSSKTQNLSLVNRVVIGNLSGAV